MLLAIHPMDEHVATLNHIAIRQVKNHLGRGAFIVEVHEVSPTEVHFEIGCSFPFIDESGDEPVILFPWIGGLGTVRVFRRGGHWYLSMPARGETSRTFELRRMQGEVNWPVEVEP